MPTELGIDSGGGDNSNTDTGGSDSTGVGGNLFFHPDPAGIMGVDNYSDVVTGSRHA